MQAVGPSFWERALFVSRTGCSVIVEKYIVLCAFVRNQKHNFGIRFHRIMRSQPDIGGHRAFFNFELGARLYLCEEAFDPNWTHYTCLNLHPLKGLLINP
jgi:hypothetical protein